MNTYKATRKLPKDDLSIQKLRTLEYKRLATDMIREMPDDIFYKIFKCSELPENIQRQNPNEWETQIFIEI